MLHRKLLLLACACCWLVDFQFIWLWLRDRHSAAAVFCGLIPALFTAAYMLRLLVSRRRITAAAKEIELQIPALDQRLMTIVSITERSALADQLHIETEQIIAAHPKLRLMQLRYILCPILLGVILGLLKLRSG